MPAYVQSLSLHLADYADPALIQRALLTGTHQMVQSQQPDCTLLDVFGAVFYPMLGLQPEVLAPAIDDFYTNVFPALKPLTRPQPGAVETVQRALDKGYLIAVATNPLFPLTAIEQRLEWAGLPPKEIPFAIVPSGESFHFTKPNPAFLAELLARLGWPDGPVVMVGDHPINDILCATELGLASYQVRKDGGFSEDGRLGAGPLSDLLPWLERTAPASLEPQWNQPSAILAILRSTPAALNHLAQNLPPDALKVRPSAAEWSLGEIFCHLRDVEGEVNLPRLRKVLQEDNPFIPGQDTDRWAEERNYFDQDGARGLQRFITTRQRVLKQLETLEAADWQRSARHAIFGPTRLHELMEIVAGHDRLHVCQALETSKGIV